MIQLSNSDRDAKHLGFTAYRTPKDLYAELCQTLFDKNDYMIKYGHKQYFLRNPAAELMMLLKHGDRIRRIEV